MIYLGFSDVTSVTKKDSAHFLQQLGDLVDRDGGDRDVLPVPEDSDRVVFVLLLVFRRRFERLRAWPHPMLSYHMFASVIPHVERPCQACDKDLVVSAEISDLV